MDVEETTCIAVMLTRERGAEFAQRGGRVLLLSLTA
jgi:hypothetical protein